MHSSSMIHRVQMDTHTQHSRSTIGEVTACLWGPFYPLCPLVRSFLPPDLYVLCVHVIADHFHSFQVIVSEAFSANLIMIIGILQKNCIFCFN